MVDFVDLHLHTHFSTFDGVSPIAEYVARAKELECKALAITDHGALYGALAFYNEWLLNSVKPILGMETYLVRGHRSEHSGRRDAWHLVLLAESMEGWRNLMRLSSLAFIEGFYYVPRVDFELLEQYHKGLIALPCHADPPLADRSIPPRTDARGQPVGGLVPDGRQQAEPSGSAPTPTTEPPPCHADPPLADEASETLRCVPALARRG